jgi:formate C-acetyltransferase
MITEAYKQSEGEPFVLRKAKALDAILSNMSIYIEDGQLIVGNQASSQRAAPIFPEYSIDWIIDELDTFASRSGDFLSSAKDQKKPRDPTYWHG